MSDAAAARVEEVNARDCEIATQIHGVLLAAYQVEAEVIGAADFPPLKRTVEDIATSSTRFVGRIVSDELVAIAEVDLQRDPAWLDSVAVHPDHFRRGHGRELIEWIWRMWPDRDWGVQTSVFNAPAIQLYLSLGFRMRRRFRTECGYDMVVLRLDR